MLDDQTKQRIIQQETSAFLDENFGGLDLSSFPSLNKPPAEEQFSPDGDRHGFNRVALPGANGLKEFTANPDGETLSRIAQETGNHELAEQLAESQATAVAQEFVSRNPAYVQSPENRDGIADYMLKKYLAQSLRVYDDTEDAMIALFNAGFWNVENIESAFRTLLRAGRLEVESGTPKVLSEGEKLHVISLCKASQLDDAIRQFLAYTFPNAESDWSDITEFLSDPNSLPARNSGVRFCWYHSRPGVQDSTEWRAFETKWFRHRPMRTVDDYDVAYAEFEKQYKNEVRNRLLFGNQPTESTHANESLDDLSDDQVDTLYRKTAREHAKTTRRTPGILE